MKVRRVLTAILLLTFTMNMMAQKSLNYPPTKKVKQTDKYFKTKVKDPYRWLEDDRSKETEAWVDSQIEFTNDYLSKLPYRDELRERLEKLWDYPKMGVPFQKGDYLFYYKNSGTQNQSVLYCQNIHTKAENVLIDPNKISESGIVSVGSISLSRDGKYMAYSLSEGGSDWNKIKLITIPDAKELDDEINWVKFSGISWRGDGFYYSSYGEPEGSALSQKNEYHKVYYHKLGEPQSKDILIYENREYPLRNYSASVSDDEDFLFIYESQSTSGNSVYFADLKKDEKKFTQIAEGFKFDYSIVEVINGKFLMKTNENAPSYKLVWVNPAEPQRENWEEFIPEQESVLQGVSLFGPYVYVQYLEKANSKAYLYDYNGKIAHEIELPGIGTIGGFSSDKEYDEAYYAFTSFSYPSTIFKLNLSDYSTEIYFEPQVDVKPDYYVTEQVFYPSKDGTKVSMFIVRKKDVELDGNNPTLLYGYGGFNISLTPSFSIIRMLFLEQGGVLAIPNLRGGGEYGKTWHRAGTKLQKQNVFDDFIAAAEYLIEKKYTNPSKIAIQGGSNGGLLVGATMLQRPDLFKVALPAVGVLDMLRYHKFTIGWAWADDYGTSDVKEEFEYIYKYSPVHNVKKGVEYPATLITTADHDDRVVPAHSFKFAAELQAKYKGKNPMLIRIDKQAGHGAGKPTSKQMDEAIDTWSFVFYHLGMTYSPINYIY